MTKYFVVWAGESGEVAQSEVETICDPLMMTTNDFDPTTNRIQFGLLSEDEQTALIHWPHSWEFYNIDRWVTTDPPKWRYDIVYRGKPKPPVVTSVWFNVYPYGPSRADNSTRKTADENCSPHRIARLRIDTCDGVTTAHLEEI